MSNTELDRDADDERGPTTVGPPGAGIRVLCVGGEDSVTERVAAELAGEEGVEPVRATDRTAAMTTIEREPVDCVVAGHGPTVDGLAVLESVREDHPRLPFVLAAESGDETVASRAVAADVTEYVPVPDADPGPVLERLHAAVGVDGTGRSTTRDRSPVLSDLSLVEELRLKERAMDEAPIGITISDPDRPDNPLIYANDGFETLTGYSKAEALGRNCRFLQGERTEEAKVAKMAKGVDEERPVTAEVLNYRKDGTEFWNRVDISPIRDRSGEVAYYVGFQTDVTERKRAERRAQHRAAELGSERRRLARLLDRIRGLIQHVTNRLIEAESRDGIESAVCECIVESDPYTFACLFDPDVETGGAVTVNACAGAGDVSPESLTVDLETDAGDRIRNAVETGRVTTGTLEATDGDTVPGPVTVDGPVEAGSPLAATEPSELAVVPLQFREARYGVLLVYADEVDAFDKHESSVLAALGRMTATAIHDVQSRRVLTADNVIDLVFTVADESFALVDVATRADARLSYEGATYRDGDRLSLFLSAEMAVEDLRSAAAESPLVETAMAVSQRDRLAVVEVTTVDPSPVSVLADVGARTERIDVDPDAGTARIEAVVSADTDARAVLTHLEERYGDVELTAYSEQRRTPTRETVFTDVSEDLTEKQREALQLAYISGFYDRDRPVSGSELAESMGINRSTFHEHLRVAERKLVGSFFEAYPGGPTD